MGGRAFSPIRSVWVYKFFLVLTPTYYSHYNEKPLETILHLLKSHGISLENICRFCKRASNNAARFLAHFKEMHPNDMPYECPRLGCERQFGKSNRLKDHLLLHRLKEGDITEDMKKLCNECGKVFYFQKKLDEHTKYVHKGLKKQKKDFHCHLCVKTYNSNSQLQAHIRKHEGNASFMW